MPTRRRAGAATPGRSPEFVADFPISEASKAQYLALHSTERDPLAGRTPQEKLALLKRTSYRDYLTKICGCSEEVANVLQGRTLGFFGLGADAVPAEDVRDLGYPGFAGPRSAAARTPRGASPTSIISRTATRRSRGCWCARSSPASRRAAPWTTWCRRRSTTASSTISGSRSASGSIRPVSTSATPATRCRSATCAAARCTASRASMWCWPASTWSFPTSCRNCRSSSARRSRRTSRRRSSIPT